MRQGFAIRAMGEDDRLPLARLFAAVAEERDGIAAEPPVDIERRAERVTVEGTFVAVVGDERIGMLHVEPTPFGVGDLGMLVAREWRGRGVGTALVAAAIAWARSEGMHKLCLGVFPHNAAAIALYEKTGFEREGLARQHIRRANGELWDLVLMGLLLNRPDEL